MKKSRKSSLLFISSLKKSHHVSTSTQATLRTLLEYNSSRGIGDTESPFKHKLCAFSDAFSGSDSGLGANNVEIKVPAQEEFPGYCLLSTPPIIFIW